MSYKLYTSPNVFGQGSTGDEPMADFQLPALQMGKETVTATTV
jgi:hypothetical protein